jgi:hypothetical protein
MKNNELLLLKLDEIFQNLNDDGKNPTFFTTRTTLFRPIGLFLIIMYLRANECSFPKINLKASSFYYPHTFSFSKQTHTCFNLTLLVFTNISLLMEILCFAKKRRMTMMMKPTNENPSNKRKIIQSKLHGSPLFVIVNYIIFSVARD